MADIETIAAVATPPGLGGVGIVRVSGPLAPEIARAVTGALPSPRTATYRLFRDAENGFIDEGIALYFPCPGSFTGEDVLELQGHGGPVVMDLLLERCLALGARLARPGEFTERAFLNGKLDLVQAEAVADLIESSTALGVRLAGRTLQGDFSRRIQSLVEELVRLRVFIEAALDFPEEEIDFLADSSVAEDLDRAIVMTRQVLDEAHRGQVLREGLVVVIAGAPNVGKSSLLNALSDTDAAIVTPIPGTTRDVLRQDIQIDGLPIRVVDTAGLRETEDPVEREGVRRARRQLDDADLVLLVYDAQKGPDASLTEALPSGIPVVRIRNKIDLIDASPRIEQSESRTEISLSVATGQGLELLRTHLKVRAGLDFGNEGVFIARRRHLDALNRGLQRLLEAQRHLAGRLGPELVAEELLLAQTAFGEITGEVTSEDLLGRIFSSFCIGK
ncbi:tRNA uridine-5-carboxymethylaminomethyl(34) synthesis GTPase MnmE [Imhoffiella purpurea]|uniref:tRNA modification GTPase MnmE n=1 Tax=Imhoffiella purpurea TaxID=1249627 RepID=W9VM13_9GAMM|nr:tRNA uridine-5-carboxymethylaminomethyl(34) synthesis GTPase MnmE [Imhoffiella purpurea]EXJ17142.1 GTPase and tRNA-U34 5-formylation enzyme TrmE [Imhoffiella purpurea]